MNSPAAPWITGGLFWLAPWVALVLAVALALAPRPKKAPPGDLREVLACEGFGWAACLAGGVACFLALGVEALRPFALPAALGFLGVLIVRAVEAARPGSPFLPAFVWALAAFAVGANLSEPGAWSALAFGSCCGALLLGAARPTKGANAAALFGLAIVLAGATGYLGGLGQGGRAAYAGVMLSLALAVAGGLGGAAATFSKNPVLPRAIPPIVVLIASVPLALRYFETPNLAMLAAMTIVGAALVAWNQGDGPGRSFAEVVAAIAWIALATVGFALMRGYGIAFAALLAVGTLALMGASRAILSAAPLVALALFRVFREWHPDTVRALDIGQHYAIIGILVGIALVIGPIEWLTTREAARGTRTGLAALLMGVGLLAVLTAAMVLMGATGAAGMLVGLGLAGLVARLQGRQSLAPVALAVALAISIVLGFGALGDVMGMVREEKLAWLSRVGLAAALPVVAALVVGGRAKPQEAAS